MWKEGRPAIRQLSVPLSCIGRTLTRESTNAAIPTAPIPNDTCPGVSILNFVIRTGVAQVNLSQHGPIPRWKRPNDTIQLPKVLNCSLTADGQHVVSWRQ
jgi:hypothetical protein